MWLTIMYAEELDDALLCPGNSSIMHILTISETITNIQFIDFFFIVHTEVRNETNTHA